MYKLGMMTEFVSMFGDTNFCLDEIKKLGYDCADLTFHKTFDRGALIPEFAGDDYKENCLKIKEHITKIGLPILQAHAPFPVHKEGNEEYNQNVFAALQRCIEICGLLNIPKVVIHPWNNWSIEENTIFFNKLLPLAKKNNVMICTENMWNWKDDRAELCACSSPENFKEQIDAVNDPYLQGCVDIGHAEMFSYVGISPYNMLKTLGDRVASLHIHDNDSIHDDHQIPYTGKIDWDKVIQGLKEINYKGDLIIETLVPSTLHHSFEDCVKYWKDQLLAGLKIKRALMGGEFYEMSNNKGLKLVTTNLGASLFDIFFNGELMTFNVENKDEYFRDKLYFGKTIGRFANRIPGNKIIVNNKEYVLEDNGNGNTLHGGQSGISTKIFDLVSKNVDDGKYFETKYKYISKHLESGFPGELTFIVTYRLYKDENRIDLIYEAETKDYPSPFSPTNHAYFCLGDDSDLGLELKINASKFLLTKQSNLLPIEVRPVESCLDFREFKKVGKDIEDKFLQDHASKGYDHYFYFDEVDPNKVQVTLRNNRYQMNVLTDYEGLQIYSDNYASDLKCRTTTKDIHRGLAIEPSFCLTDLHLLEPGKKVRNTITYLFSKR